MNSDQREIQRKLRVLEPQPQRRHGLRVGEMACSAFWGLWRRDEFQFVPVAASVRRLEESHPDDPDIHWRVYDAVSHRQTYQEGPDTGKFPAQHIEDLLDWLEVQQARDMP